MANSQLFILILQWSAITRHIKRPSNILKHQKSEKPPLSSEPAPLDSRQG